MQICTIRRAVVISLLTINLLAADLLLITSGGTNQVLAYDASSGAYLKVFAAGSGLTSPDGMALGPDGNLYVSSTGTDQVLRFDRNTGAFLGPFVSGIRRPSALAWGPDGNLYVGSYGTEAIYKCQGRTGQVLATFGHAAGSFAFAGDQNLYVANTSNNTIEAFDPNTGALLRSFGFGSGLNAPAGIAFQSAVLFVASNLTNSIFRFALDGVPAPPLPFVPELSHPLALAFAPDGNLYVSTSGSEVLRFESNGRFLGRLVTSGSGGLQYPAAMVFLPAQPAATNPPDTVRIVSGDSQSSVAGNMFSQPLVVEVLSGTRPLPAQIVRFDVTSGTAFLAPPQPLTDPLGRATTNVFAADYVGPVSVRATAGTVSALFNLTVTPPPPLIAPGGIVHAARRTPMGLPDAAIALGATFVLEGKGLGPVIAISATIPYPNRLPDNAAGTSVRLIHDADNSSIDAPVVFASATRIIAIVPSTAHLGVTSVVASYEQRQSKPVRTTVVAANFGIHTRNELGHGPAVAMTVDESGVKRSIGLSNPARPGQIVAIRGTGLGPITTADNSPSNAPFDLSDIDVLIGNLAVRPLSAGRSLDAPATDEIQFRIPDDASLPDGCYLPLAVRSGATFSNFATIPKSTSENAGCAHPLKLSHQNLARLDAGESIDAGVFGITRMFLQTPLGPGLLVGEGGIFSKFDANSLYIPGGLTTMTVTEGACTVYQAPAQFEPSPLFPVPLGRGLDAGPTLTLTAPDLHTDRLLRRSSGAYDKSSFADGLVLPKQLQGEWRLSGPGGVDVNPFTATLELPPPIVWSNKDEIDTIDRTQDVMVTWQTDGEARFEKVVVSGGMIRGNELYTNGVFIQFACSAPFHAGSLVVPSLILRQLPASTSDDYLTFFTVANSSFDARSSTFPASSSAGRPMDATATTYVMGEGKTVTFR